VTNAIDFIRESAVYMVKQRPDIYDHTEAVADLIRAMDDLRDDPRRDSVKFFSSFMLVRSVEDGCEEYVLGQKLSAFVRFEQEAEATAYTFVEDIDLPAVDEPVEAVLE
jgi:hypothetical protein